MVDFAYLSELMCQISHARTLLVPYLDVLRSGSITCMGSVVKKRKGLDCGAPAFAFRLRRVLRGCYGGGVWPV